MANNKKMNTKKISILASLTLLSAVTGFMVPNASATVIISDTFSGTAPNGLYGTTTPVGSAVWVGNNTPPIFTGANSVTNNSTHVSSLAVVALTAGYTTYTISANANFTGNDWGTLQFSNNPSGSDIFSSSLTFLFNQQGTPSYNLYINGLGTRIATGHAGNSTGFNNLQLQYNATLDTASVFVNGTEVVASISLGAFTPDTTYAGFSFYSDTGHTASDTQLSTFQIDAVPEPAAWSLLAFSLTTVFVLRRRPAGK